ncbi:MAG: hypothetical protein HC930_07910, partial [Hydrococcus sp. SU_1_0]|nr:hypothetical protein [Hydrococcus sp. SU_1_0]
MGTVGNTYARFRLTTDSSITNATPGGFASNGEVEDYQIAIANSYDYGDAPNTYGDARHQILADSTVYLGSIQPDQESGTQLGTDAGAAATGDDQTGGNDDQTGDDEDAFSSLGNVSTIGNYYLIVPVNNTSGGNATLHAWIDFDKDGKFASGEYKSVTVANNATNISLNWLIPSGTTAGNTYVRFRLTTDSSLTDKSGTDNVDERSIGNATNGEVEDYKVAIASENLTLGSPLTCDSTFYITIGNGGNNPQSLYDINRSGSTYTFTQRGLSTSNTNGYP